MSDLQSYKPENSDKKAQKKINGTGINSQQTEFDNDADEFSGLLRQIDNSCYGPISQNHFTSVKRNQTSKNSSTVNMFPFGSVVIHDQNDDNALDLNSNKGQFSTMAPQNKTRQ